MPKDIIQTLLEIRTAEEVKSFVTQMMKDGKYRFEPVSGERTNSNHIELADEPIAPLIERITNGIDAVLERTEFEKRDGSSPPFSPRAAAQKWFGIRDGHLDTLSLSEIHKLADNIEIALHDSGEEKNPTVVIRDYGIAQHPTELSRTILSLGGQNKIGKHYLCGAYGHGGSSTFAWCNFSIIISRRRPEHEPGKPDLIGWTIVRKNQDDETAKTTVYEYLVCEDKTIPFIDPKECKEDFAYGTHISHIAYEMEKYAGPASLVGYRLFQSKLFDPILPYWIVDDRKASETEKQFRRALAGNMRRLRGRDADGGKSQVEYSNDLVRDLGEDGKITVRYWVFKVKPQDAEGKNQEKFYLDSYLDTRNSTRSVPITLNGQQQHCLDKQFVKQETKLSFLADYLLVQVECEQLALKRKKDIFVATRTKMREGPKRLDLIKDVVIDALKNDERLKKMEEERAKATLAKMDEKSEKEVRNLLDRLIVAPQLSTKGGVLGSDQGPGTEITMFEPNDPPTYLEFLSDQDVIELVPGEITKVQLEMDGPDDLFSRKQNRAKLSIEVTNIPKVQTQMNSVKFGRIEIQITVPKDADPNLAGTLKCEIQMKDLPLPIIVEKEVVVVPHPLPFAPVDPPTFIEIAGRKNFPLHLKRGKKTNISIVTDAPDDILTRLQNPAVLDYECTIAGATFVARRGLSEGTIRVQIAIPDTTSDGTTGKLIVRLRLSNGTILEDIRECVVVPPPTPRNPKKKGGGSRQRPIPNYEIIQVDEGDRNWIEFGWDKTYVGKFVDSGMLYLYVSANFHLLEEEQERRRKVGDGPLKIGRMWKRYFAHVAYHLYLCAEAARDASEKSQEEPPSTSVVDEKVLQNEMRRVGNTIILLLRSATDLLGSEE